MFAYAAVAPGAVAGVPSTVTGKGATAGADFAQILSQAGAATDPAPVDAKDEDAALKELFKLVAMLSLGVVDPALLGEQDADPAKTAGPVRREVEALKEVLRRLLRRGSDAADTELDPVTGKPKPVTHSGSSSSLAALVHSLPANLQNLLRRAFPDLDQQLREELEALGPVR